MSPSPPRMWGSTGWKGRTRPTSHELPERVALALRAVSSLDPITPKNVPVGGLFSSLGAVQSEHRVRRGGQTAPAPGRRQGLAQALTRQAAGSMDALDTGYPGPGLSTPKTAGAARPCLGRGSHQAPELPSAHPPTYPWPCPLPLPHLGRWDQRPGPSPASVWVISSACCGGREGCGGCRLNQWALHFPSDHSPRSRDQSLPTRRKLLGNFSWDGVRKSGLGALRGPCKLRASARQQSRSALGSLLLLTSGSSAHRGLVVCLGGCQASWV